MYVCISILSIYQGCFPKTEVAKTRHKTPHYIHNHYLIYLSFLFFFIYIERASQGHKKRKKKSPLKRWLPKEDSVQKKIQFRDAGVLILLS